jgi:hypothetical protein
MSSLEVWLLNVDDHVAWTYALVIRAGDLEENGKSNDQDETRYHFVKSNIQYVWTLRRSNSII